MRKLFFFLFSMPLVLFADISFAESVLDWRGYFVIIILLVMIIFLISEIFPPDLILILGGTVPVIFGIVPAERLLLSFANETIVTIAALFVVVRAFEKTGLVVYFVRKFLPKTGARLKQLVRLLTPLSFFSAFMNNTPLVMVLTPVVRKWALSKKLHPSKFLIPLSYAAILGGTCTLIGTSTNLIVNGLLLQENPLSAFSFFEIGKVGFPCAVVGLLYLFFFSNKLLPTCKDPETSLSENLQKMTAEFYVEEGFFYIGKTIQDFDRKVLQGDFSIIEIYRNKKKIITPKPTEKLEKDDRLLFIGDVNCIARLQQIHGLQFETDSDFTWDHKSSHFSEFVIRSDSQLVGKTVKSAQFRKKIGGMVFAIYRQGVQVRGKIGEIAMKAGDVLMVFSNKPYSSEEGDSNQDLYLMKPSEEIVTLNSKRAIFVVLTVILMIYAASFHVSMMIAALSAAAIFIVTKTVSGSGVIKGIHWNLLLLIAGGLAFSSALEVTNVASFFGEQLFRLIGSKPRMIVAAVFLLTTIFTEFITNTAAVLIVFPIALQALQISGLASASSMRGLGITMAIAGSCSFLTPIGYQTNTIVFGPGGYRFFDYMKIGIPLNLIIWLLCVWLIPILWQF